MPDLRRDDGLSQILERKQRTDRHMVSPSAVTFSPAQEAAQALLEGPARYVCLAGGARSGKTFLITRAIVERAIQAPDSRHALLRLHANHAQASIAKDTLPTVMRRCFEHVTWKEYRQDLCEALKSCSD